MRGYVQQFHDEGGDAVDRMPWRDLNSRSDTALDRIVAVRIVVLIALAMLTVLGVVGATTIQPPSPLILPSMMAIFAGVLNGGIAAVFLRWAIRERRERRWSARLGTAADVPVRLGVARSHSLTVR